MTDSFAQITGTALLSQFRIVVLRLYATATTQTAGSSSTHAPEESKEPLSHKNWAKHMQYLTKM